MELKENDLIEKCKITMRMMEKIRWNSLDSVFRLTKRRLLTRKTIDILDQFLCEYVEKKQKMISDERKKYGEWPLPKDLLTYETSNAIDKLDRATKRFYQDVARFQNLECIFDDASYQEAHNFMVRLVSFYNSHFCNSTIPGSLDGMLELLSLKAKWSYAYHKSIQIVLAHVPKENKNLIETIIDCAEPNITLLLNPPFGNLPAVHDMLADGSQPFRKYMRDKALEWMNGESSTDVGSTEIVRMFWRLEETLGGPTRDPVPIRNHAFKRKLSYLSKQNDINFDEPLAQLPSSNAAAVPEVVDLVEPEAPKAKQPGIVLAEVDLTGEDENPEPAPENPEPVEHMVIVIDNSDDEDMPENPPPEANRNVEHVIAN